VWLQQAQSFDNTQSYTSWQTESQ